MENLWFLEDSPSRKSSNVNRIPTTPRGPRQFSTSRPTTTTRPTNYRPFVDPQSHRNWGNHGHQGSYSTAYNPNIQVTQHPPIRTTTEPDWQPVGKTEDSQYEGSSLNRQSPSWGNSGQNNVNSGYSLNQNPGYAVPNNQGSYSQQPSK